MSTSRRRGEEKALAIEGGPKAVEKLGPYPPKVGADELLAVMDLWPLSRETTKRIRDLIRKDPPRAEPHMCRYYGRGQTRVARAEERMRDMVGVKHVLAVNSATSALIAALRALGVGANDEVIIPGYTFFATAAAVVACNALPVICEVGDSLNLDAEDAKRKLTRRTRAVIPVHMRGVPAQMDAIMDLAHAKGLPVIEDAAQAFGGSFKGRMLGAIGTLGCFSFDAFKLASCGEGGFLTTQDDYLAMRATSWHDTAACWRPDRYAPERVAGELFCGENYRMSELQGAVAVPQIRKIASIVRKLRANKRRIKSRIALPAGASFRRLPDADGDVGSVITLFVPDKRLQAKIVPALAAEGVPARSPYGNEDRDWHVYCYWEHILRRKSVARDGLPWSARPRKDLPGYSKAQCPRTLDLLGRAVTVAVQPHYTASDCRAIASAVNKVLAHYLT